jgi:hypothetical protein
LPRWHDKESSRINGRNSTQTDHNVVMLEITKLKKKKRKKPAIA